MVKYQFLLTATDGAITKCSKHFRQLAKPESLKSTIAEIDGFFKSKINSETKAMTETFDNFPVYSINDVPLSISTNPRMAKVINEYNNKVIDTDIVTASLLETGEHKYLDSVLQHCNTKGNQILLSYLDKGYSFQVCANIMQKSKIYLTNTNPETICDPDFIKSYTQILDEAFLQSKSYPLKSVLKAMDEAIIEKDCLPRPENIRFAIQNPGKISLVTTQNEFHIKRLDKVAAENFPYISHICPQNINLRAIMDSCIYTSDKTSETKAIKELIDLAIKFIQKNNGWSKTDSKIFQLLKRGIKKDFDEWKDIDQSLYNTINDMIKKGNSSEEIYKAISNI